VPDIYEQPLSISVGMLVPVVGFEVALTAKAELAQQTPDRIGRDLMLHRA
jgi:hypothetical protein